MTMPRSEDWWAWLDAFRRTAAAARPATTWRRFLDPYLTPEPLVSGAFLERWGDERWSPTDDDSKAAGKLHTQIVSRIASQRLAYLDGVEKSALDSVYALFQKTRDIVDEYPACRHFDAIAWDVLNTHVRPFTAKWHRQSEQGALNALDATDEFRADLAVLQPILRSLDALLIEIRDGRPAPPAGADSAERARLISDEMKEQVPWGIPDATGGLPSAVAQEINKDEKQVIEAREGRAKRAHAIGLALSGGGIRSATFSLGVLVALAKRGILPQIDYLSTVSGGGYIGAFLSAFLESPDAPEIGLGPGQQPFSRENGESAALRHIRHQSKYLASGSWRQRMQMLAAQLYGMVLNALAIVLLVAGAVLIERVLRAAPFLDGWRTSLIAAAIGGLMGAAIVALSILRFSHTRKSVADWLVASAAGLLLAVLCWYQLPALRAWFRAVPSIGWSWFSLDKETWLAISGIVPLISSAFAILFGPRFQRAKVLLVALASIAAPLFLFGIYLGIYYWGEHGAQVSLPLAGSMSPGTLLGTAVGAGALLYLLLFDINATSPHRHYRDKVAGAYLIQVPRQPRPGNPFNSNVVLPLSSLCSSRRAPYHLINCALNVPGSKNPRMQGRLTDFFLFSPRYCGSPLTGYTPTPEWEAQDRHLDLGTAMAISGAAAAPQMGLGTMRRWSFWLALLNVRLGYWVAPPMKSRRIRAPGLALLLREMLGNMHEGLGWLNLSDGGHIENLGLYELLRRRCKYVIAIDGEQDPKMTFQALTTLQRMAFIDFGITIDLDLDDLRLNDQGLSRSHFRFCRIHYPSASGVNAATGYLLYVKLSLTGNEGEFIRRYRLDEPVFPHHSTADQLFSEAQFEAYRSLGEHVGDKLFLRPLVGALRDSDDVQVEEWFRRLGVGLLEPRRTHAGAGL